LARRVFLHREARPIQLFAAELVRRQGAKSDLRVALRRSCECPDFCGAARRGIGAALQDILEIVYGLVLGLVSARQRERYCYSGLAGLPVFAVRPDWDALGQFSSG